MLRFRKLIDRLTGERSARFWTAVGGIAAVLSLLVTVVAVLAGNSGSSGSVHAGAAAPARSHAPATTIPPSTAGGPAPTSAASGAAAPPPTEPPVTLEQQVNLDKYTGVDLDGGRVRYPLRQGAQGVDLYLDWGYILYSSVLHSEMYDDTDQGDQAGAHDRCARYRQLNRTTLSHQYIGAGTQLCIVTSEGNQGWVQVNSAPLDNPGGVILKVVIWAEQVR